MSKLISIFDALTRLTSDLKLLSLMLALTKESFLKNVLSRMLLKSNSVADSRHFASIRCNSSKLSGTLR